MNRDLTEAVELIKEFEGFVGHAYKDSVGVVTIGYGTTVYPNGKKVRMGDKCTREQGTAYMFHDFETIRMPAIERLVKVPLKDNEVGALLSFVYNVGVGSLKKSTLLKKLNAKRPKIEVADEFLKWVRAGGRVLSGLVRRRKRERELFLHSDHHVDVEIG